MHLLTQLGYGMYLHIEVPLALPNGLTGDAWKAAQALQEALAAFGRGDYEEAMADCRPGFEALRDADKGKFGLPAWDQNASKEERFYWIQRSLLSLAHLAHHPNDPAAAGSADTPGLSARWGRADAEAAIATLATLIRWRIERG